MSTELASIKLVDDICLNVDKGNLVGAMFIDLTKAFDTVNHSQLLNKLPQYGVHGEELDWFKDYLFQRMVRVAYNGNLSQEWYSFIGVLQGSILGPLLFVIAFNDITDVIKESSRIMYADDVVLYVAADDIKAINSKLSNDMESIADWMDKNEFINLKEGKTETLLLGTTKRLTKLNEALSVSYKESTLRQVSVYKYLGVEINSSLNLNSHFDATFKRASSRLRLLQKIRPQLNLPSAKAIYKE